MSINTDINNRIQIVRNIFTKTQNKFSEELGFTQGIISKIENNKVPVTEDIILRVENVYGVSSSWILTGEQPFLNINPDKEKDLLKHLENIYGLNKNDLAVIRHFLNLNQEQRNILFSIFSDKETP